MKLKCIQNQESGWFGCDFSKSLTIGKEYFGQIIAYGSSGSLEMYTCFCNDKKWRIVDLNWFVPVEE